MSPQINNILIGFCIATAIVIWRIDVARDSFGESRPTPSDDSSNFGHLTISDGAQIQTKGAQDYLEILERPLFNPARLPPDTDNPTQTLAADIAANGASALSASKLKLIGLIIDNERRAALIVNVDSASTQLVDVGKSIGGWHLEKIDAASATLTKSSQSERLTLVRKSDPLAARRVQAARRRRQQSIDRPLKTNDGAVSEVRDGKEKNDDVNEDEDHDELLDDEDE